MILLNEDINLCTWKCCNDNYIFSCIPLIISYKNLQNSRKVGQLDGRCGNR